MAVIRHKEAIHSGQFMVSEFEAEAEDLEEEISAVSPPPRPPSVRHPASSSSSESSESMSPSPGSVSSESPASMGIEATVTPAVGSPEQAPTAETSPAITYPRKRPEMEHPHHFKKRRLMYSESSSPAMFMAMCGDLEDLAGGEDAADDVKDDDVKMENVASLEPACPRVDPAGEDGSVKDRTDLAGRLGDRDCRGQDQELCPLPSPPVLPVELELQTASGPKGGNQEGLWVTTPSLRGDWCPGQHQGGNTTTLCGAATSIGVATLKMIAKNSLSRYRVAWGGSLVPGLIPQSAVDSASWLNLNLPASHSCAGGNSSRRRSPFSAAAVATRLRLRRAASVVSRMSVESHPGHRHHRLEAAGGASSSSFKDVSLSQLFKSMSIAYREKLTSPKWNRFRGLRLRWKDKIRLNNVIWRCWHLQFVQGRQRLLCSFANPLEIDHHNSLEGGPVVSGKYWKRKMETIKNEYMRWRLFYHSLHEEDCCPAASPSRCDLLQKRCLSTEPGATRSPCPFALGLHHHHLAAGGLAKEGRPPNGAAVTADRALIGVGAPAAALFSARDAEGRSLASSATTSSSTLYTSTSTTTITTVATAASQGPSGSSGSSGGGGGLDGIEMFLKPSQAFMEGIKDDGDLDSLWFDDDCSPLFCDDWINDVNEDIFLALKAGGSEVMAAGDLNLDGFLTGGLGAAGGGAAIGRTGSDTSCPGDEGPGPGGRTSAFNGADGFPQSMLMFDMVGDDYQNATNADFIQPGLPSLQPNLDDFGMVDFRGNSIVQTSKIISAFNNTFSSSMPRLNNNAMQAGLGSAGTATKPVVVGQVVKASSSSVSVKNSSVVCSGSPGATERVEKARSVSEAKESPSGSFLPGKDDQVAIHRRACNAEPAFSKMSAKFDSMTTKCACCSNHLGLQVGDHGDGVLGVGSEGPRSSTEVATVCDRLGKALILPSVPEVPAKVEVPGNGLTNVGSTEVVNRAPFEGSIIGPGRSASRNLPLASPELRTLTTTTATPTATTTHLASGQGPSAPTATIHPKHLSPKYRLLKHLMAPVEGPRLSSINQGLFQPRPTHLASKHESEPPQGAAAPIAPGESPQKVLLQSLASTNASTSRTPAPRELIQLLQSNRGPATGAAPPQQGPGGLSLHQVATARLIDRALAAPEEDPNCYSSLRWESQGGRLIPSSQPSLTYEEEHQAVRRMVVTMPVSQPHYVAAGSVSTVSSMSTWHYLQRRRDVSPQETLYPDERPPAVVPAQPDPRILSEIHLLQLQKPALQQHQQLQQQQQDRLQQQQQQQLLQRQLGTDLRSSAKVEAPTTGGRAARILRNAQQIPSPSGFDCPQVTVLERFGGRTAAAAMDFDCYPSSSPEGPSNTVGDDPRIGPPQEDQGKARRRPNGSSLTSGFDVLRELIPSLNSSSAGANLKVSKAALLHKGGDHLAKLKDELAEGSKELQDVRAQIAQLEAELEALQNSLPGTDRAVAAAAPSAAGPAAVRGDSLTDLFDRHVRKCTLKHNWKYWAYSLLMHQAFHSFQRSVRGGSFEDLVRTCLVWLDQSFDLPHFRTVTSTALRDLCLSTSLLDEPARLPDESVAAVLKLPKKAAPVPWHGSPVPGAAHARSPSNASTTSP